MFSRTMDFGAMSSVSHIQFELPPEVKRKDTGLWKLDESKVFVGCPIWGNKDWKGIVFPEKTPAKDYLKYYAEKFSAIELNSTFYHLPPIETLKKWREQTPSSFLFCPKIPQDISHTARFTENTDLIVESLRVFSLFEEQLGHVFLQLPPGFERSQFSLLKKFLTLWKQELPLAIEFRHPSWFKSGYLDEEVQELLSTNDTTAVICDTPGRRDVVHVSFLSGVLFVRFLGAQGDATDLMRLQEWSARVKEWAEEEVLKKVYFFVHQPNDGLAPDSIVLFLKALNEFCDWQVPLPSLREFESEVKEEKQGMLF